MVPICVYNYALHQHPPLFRITNPMIKFNLERFLKIKFIILGDLLGPSMDGIDKLLAMPYGCGEQNMLKFAPNVYIMDYLKATQQSNKKIEDKAKEYMRSGLYLFYSYLFQLKDKRCLFRLRHYL